MTAPTRLFVYGSCVSRDTVEAMERATVSLVAYVARQSVVSAFGPPAPLELVPEGLSRFQRRMVEGDLSSNLPDRVTQEAARVDLLLWDLVDERLGVYALPDGSYVTRTPEIVGSELESRLRQRGELVEFGTDRHFLLWSEATTRWMELLVRCGLADRTLVLAPPWAVRRSDGGPVPSSFGLDPATANELSRRYLDHLRGHGLPVAGTDESTTLASAAHRWGAAPFHYDDATYAALVRHIESTARSLPEREPPVDPTHRHAEPGPARASGRAADFLAEPTFTATRVGDVLTITTGVPPSETAWLSFAYYVRAGTERLSTRWYDRDPVHVVRGADAVQATSVACFARDPWGGQVIRSVPVTDRGRVPSG